MPNKQMAQLERDALDGLPASLAWVLGGGGSSDALTVLDHGPIFRLVRLLEFGPALTKSWVYRRWWTREVVRWAGLLDLVVWLDAPDSVLQDRIDTRGSDHRVRQRPFDEVRGFLSRYRHGYRSVVSAMTARRRLHILHFNTDQVSPTQIADEVLEPLFAGHHTDST